LSYGVATRLARYAPDETLFYEGSYIPKGETTAKTVKYVIPPGNAIGMTNVLIHHNPDIFPNPDKFEPTRWLTGEGKRRIELERYLLSFSKGSRQCLGMK
jgi:cytochrome P450